jgi:hypothetical protein
MALVRHLERVGPGTADFELVETVPSSRLGEPFVPESSPFDPGRPPRRGLELLLVRLAWTLGRDRTDLFHVILRRSA